MYCVLEFNSDYESYICIESLTVDKRKDRYLYIGNLENKKELKAGRSHDCDLLLNDVSVSRFHFKLINHFDNLFIEDLDSKFGTLILIQTPELILNNTLPLYIQVGRTFVYIKIKKPFSLFSCCNVSEKGDEFYYHKQNEKHIHYQKNIIVKEEDDLDDDDDVDNEKNNQNIHNLKVIEVDSLNNDKDDETQVHMNRLTSIGTSCILKSINHNQELISKILNLDLSDNKIGKNDITDLINYICDDSCNLENLNLFSNLLGDENIKKISEALSKYAFNRMEIINFGKNNISD